MQVASPVAEFGGDAPPPVILDVGEEHAGSLGVHQPSGRFTQPARGPGDDGDLSRNPSCHGSPSRPAVRTARAPTGIRVAMAASCTSVSILSTTTITTGIGQA